MNRCGVCGGPPAECPCPEHWASVECWWLGKFIGRKVWTRPYDITPQNTLPRWSTLLEIWREDNNIVYLIDWDGKPRQVRASFTNTTPLELTPEESKHVRVTEFGGGCRSTTYDPWGSGPPPALEQREPPPRDTPSIPATVAPPTAAPDVGPQFVLFDL